MKINKIISLEEGTCCHRAVLHMIEKFDIDAKPEIIFKKSFEEAKRHLKDLSQEGVVMLVPHVNDMCKELTFENGFDWNSDLLFHLQNPKLFLAENLSAEQNNTCVALPVLRNLISDDFIFTKADNTQDAACSCNKGEARYCITNETGLKKYQLLPVRELKPMNVLWLSFSYKK